MTKVKQIHLRSDEYNNYIQEFKKRYVIEAGEITPEEKGIIYRCGIDYGLTFDEKLQVRSYNYPLQDYNIIFRIKGQFTLSKSANWNSEHGPMSIRPYIIHESATAQRLKTLAQNLITEKLVESVVPIDSDYLYEALRESVFTIAMEDVLKLGVGFQIIQVEFDDDGHFKALELDETHY